ncbi:hypothetical protein D3C87_1394940 [compost metagenome]
MQHFVLGEAEVDPHRVQLGHVGQQAVGRIDIGAHLLFGEAGQPVHGRGDGGIAEVQLRVDDVGLGLLDRRRRGLFLAHGVVQVLLAQGVLGGQRPHAVQVGARRGQPRLLLRQLRVGGGQRGLEWLLVHTEQHVAGLDQRALGIGALLQEAVHAGPDLHLLRTLRLAHELEVQRHVSQRHGDHAHVGHRWRRGLALLLAAARGQHQRRQQRHSPSADPAAHRGLPSTHATPTPCSGRFST